VRTFWNDSTLRDSVQSSAAQIVRQGGNICAATASTSPAPTPSSTTAGEQLQCIADRLNSVRRLTVPLGWPTLHWSTWSNARAPVFADPRVPHATWDWLVKLAGLLLTGAALSLGAPFWFDLLNKVTYLRATGNPPPSTSREAPLEDSHKKRAK